MRLLHLYAGNLFGGIERFLITLQVEKDACSSMSHEFGLCFEGKTAAELRRLNALVHMLGEVKVSRPWTVLAARQRLRRVISEGQFDAVITHSYWPHAVFAPAVQRAGKPVIFWAHDTPDGKGWLQKWAGMIKPDHVISNSRYTDSHVPLLFGKVASTVIYYPVSPSPPLDRPAVRRTIREELRTPEDKVVIVHSARMEPWKGHVLLISALEKMKANPQWHCWIAGGVQRPHEQEYLRQLQDQAAGAGIGDRVQFLGQRSDIPKLLAAADIHCQPNLGPEPFGIAFIEALYAGLPVVTTAIGAPAEYLTADCAMLTPAEDATTLASRLDELAHSGMLREQMGTAGPKLARHLCGPSESLERLRFVVVAAMAKIT